jgi:putative membrane protein
MKTSQIYLSAAIAATLSMGLSAFPVLSQATAPVVPSAEAAAPVAAADATAPVPKAFVQDAFQANEFELAASQVAVKKATSPKVKAYAKAAVAEKTAIRAQMTTAIQSAQSDMQFTQDWTPAQKAKLAELNAAKGKSFDTKYVGAVADTLDKAVPQFEDYASRGTDAAIRDFAAGALPKLKDAQAQVQTLLSTGA